MVICQKCKNQMQLVRFPVMNEGIPGERFLYECVPCGVLDNPRRNTPNNRFSQADILKSAIDMGLVLDLGVLEELSKSKIDYFNFLSLCKSQNKTVIKLEDVRRVV